VPKIIENIREQLLNETRAQVERQGYGRTTIRSVANACGIAVSTVYNYFPSKDIKRR
jgi:AcrR family transcriptional regulator